LRACRRSPSPPRRASRACRRAPSPRRRVSRPVVGFRGHPVGFRGRPSSSVAAPSASRTRRRLRREVVSPRRPPVRLHRRPTEAEGALRATVCAQIGTRATKQDRPAAMARRGQRGHVRCSDGRHVPATPCSGSRDLAPHRVLGVGPKRRLGRRNLEQRRHRRRHDERLDDDQLHAGALLLRHRHV
jgi:hypothetical protein